MKCGGDATVQKAKAAPISTIRRGAVSLKMCVVHWRMKCALSTRLDRGLTRGVVADKPAPVIFRSPMITSIPSI
jgi:hypothetical protein